MKAQYFLGIIYEIIIILLKLRYEKSRYSKADKNAFFVNYSLLLANQWISMRDHAFETSSYALLSGI